jgi:hypothetical protein
MKGFSGLLSMKGDGKLPLLIGIGFSLAFMLNEPSLAQTVEPIGEDEEYACVIWEDGETTLGVWDEDEADYVEASFSRELRNIKREVQSLKKKLNRAKRRKNQALVQQLQEEIAYLNDLISDIQACRLGEYEGGTEEPPVVTPTTPPAPGNSGDACSLIGAPGSQISASIINGQVCGTAESAVVQLEMGFRDGSAGSCTGTVISQNAIVSAAHCLDGQVSYVDIFIGSRRVRASSFHSHPNWSSSQQALENYDVAVVLVNQPLNAPAFPILSGNDTQPTVGEQVLIAGYGRTESLKSQGLRAGFMTLSQVTELLIEARFDGKTGSNSCNGDSGGPLFVKRGEQWYLAGDTSNGDAANCGVTEGSDISRWANLNAPANRAFIMQYTGL